MVNLQILFLIATLLAISFILYFFCVRVPHSNSTILDKSDKWWICGLSITYFLISLIHFADFRTYDKAWQVENSGAQLVVTFNHPNSLVLYIILRLS